MKVADCHEIIGAERDRVNEWIDAHVVKASEQFDSYYKT